MTAASQPRQRRTLGLWWALGVAAVLAGMALYPLSRSSIEALRNDVITVSSLAFMAAAIVAGTTGALILTHERRNGVGLALYGNGIGFALSIAIFGLASVASEAGQAIMAAVVGGIAGGIVTFATVLILVAILLFPTGSLPSRRWKPVGWVLSAAAIVGTSAALVTGGFGGSASVSFFGTIPLLTAMEPVADIADDVFFVLLLVGALAAASAPFVRFRDADGIQRLQIKWVVTAAGVFGMVRLLTEVFAFPQAWLGLLEAVGFVAVPIAMAAAILRYRLYDIDVVISRTVTYGLLAVFITGTYALIVVGVGTLIGGGVEQNLALSIAAVAIVALGFEPLRGQLQRRANRLVFGARANPYEVLSQTTARLAATTDTEDPLGQISQLVAGGTGASEAVMWLRAGTTLQPHSGTPPETLDGLRPVEMVAHEIPVVPGNISTLVYHRGEILGAISIVKPRGQTVTNADEKVLADVAAGAGLLLRNIGLNSELSERADQLRVSRRRLVEAHDAERHRLERDLHDGAQQQIVALKVKLGIAKTLSQREQAKDVTDVVSSLADDTQIAVDAMRAVAHGIYPPLLETEGLPAALGALARTATIPIDIQINGHVRHDRTIEEAVYFCLLAIISQAIDAGSTDATIEVDGQPGGISFCVTHNETTTDLIAVRDRIDAYGGTVKVDRGSHGVTVSGQVPALSPSASSDRATADQRTSDPTSLDEPVLADQVVL